MRGTARLSAMMSTLLGGMLCAGCMVRPISVAAPPPPHCSRYADIFLDETLDADGPADKTSKAWVGFGVGQTGQLKSANADKRKAKAVLHVCEDDYDAAIKAAQHKLKPWYKRILGRTIVPVGIEAFYGRQDPVSL